MPFNYLACSIKGTAFSEQSSLLLITREMNSLSGGAYIPNATPLPKHTLHPHPRAHCGYRRHVNRRSGAPGKEARPVRPAPALRSPPRGPDVAGRLGATIAASHGAGPQPYRREKARQGAPPRLPARFLVLPGPGAPPVGLRTSSSRCTFRSSLRAEVGGVGRRVPGKRNGVSQATRWRLD